MNRNKKTIGEKIKQRTQMIWMDKTDVLADILFVLMLASMFFTIAGIVTQHKPLIILGLILWGVFFVTLRIAHKHKF